MSRYRKLTLISCATALAFGLAACSSSDKTAAVDPEPEPTQTPQEMCEGGGGEWRAGACVTAEELAEEARQAAITSLKNAVDAATTAVAGLTDDASDTAIGSAEAAVAAAEAALAASDLDDDVKGGYSAAIQSAKATLATKKASIAAARSAADKATMETNAKLGKAMRAALAGPTPASDNALANLTSTTLTTAGAFTADAAQGAGALADEAGHAPVVFETGTSAGSLDGWMGTDYAKTDGVGNAKVTNEARVYINKGAPTSKRFIDLYTIITETGDNQGYYSVPTTGAANLAKVMASAFTHSGTQTHTKTDGKVSFRGTYDGAPGMYRCSGGDACTSTNDGKGSPSAMAGMWHFRPDTGAMVSQPDANYLYFGWWVRKDKDGMPTVASAFAGEVGNADGTDGTTNGATLTGSATYAGNAVGKFAMSNPLTATGNGGHFTADAMLKATFGSGDDAGMTGTLDNFRLNDGSEDPGWSVELARAAWNDSAGFASTATEANSTNGIADGTVWSINGNAAAESGTWSGTMYDEMPGNPPAGDGSNIPTTVTGTFYSEFSTIGRMVGAFGADKQ